MDMDKNIKITYDLYKSFSTKIFGKVASKFNEKGVETFLTSIYKVYGKGSVGEQLLRNYFIFQYYYWSNLETEMKVAPISWIIGKKAILRWFNNDYPDLSVPIRELRRWYGIHSDIHEELSGSENRSLRISNNISHCIVNTSLFNHEIVECSNCMHAGECRGILVSTYPKLAVKRGYFDSNVRRKRSGNVI